MVKLLPERSAGEKLSAGSKLGEMLTPGRLEAATDRHPRGIVYARKNWWHTDCVETVLNDENNRPSDGLVFVPASSPYLVGRAPSVLKWKDPGRITIDFLVVHSPERGYGLRLAEGWEPPTKYGRLHSPKVRSGGVPPPPGSTLQKAGGAWVETLPPCVSVQDEWVGKIVECKWVAGEWHVHMVRLDKDKNNANARDNFLDTIRVIEENVTAAELVHVLSH